MLYDSLVETYVKLEATTKRLEMTSILAKLLSEANPEEMAEVVYLTQGKIHPDWTGSQQQHKPAVITTRLIEFIPSDIALS